MESVRLHAPGAIARKVVKTHTIKVFHLGSSNPPSVNLDNKRNSFCYHPPPFILTIDICDSIASL